MCLRVIVVTLGKASARFSSRFGCGSADPLDRCAALTWLRMANGTKIRKTNRLLRSLATHGPVLALRYWRLTADNWLLLLHFQLQALDLAHDDVIAHAHA